MKSPGMVGELKHDTVVRACIEFFPTITRITGRQTRISFSFRALCFPAHLMGPRSSHRCSCQSCVSRTKQQSVSTVLEQPQSKPWMIQRIHALHLYRPTDSRASRQTVKHTMRCVRDQADRKTWKQGIRLSGRAQPSESSTATMPDRLLLDRFS